jgi:FkbM family methyltransferase
MLRVRAINALVRAVLRPFTALWPAETLARIPFFGIARVRLRPGLVVALESDGGDLIASAIDWRGLAGWEPETFAVLQQLLPTVATCFDVGASTGVFSLTVALDDARRRVFAFEAAPGMLARLRRNLELNRAANVEIVEGAVCDREGTIDLFVPPGMSLPFGASTLDTFRSPGERLPVRAVQLDAFATARGIARVDLLKLDTEGTEPSVLAGAREVLARDEPWIVCEVLHGMTEPALHAVLDPLGYRYFAIGARGLERRERIVGDPTYRDRNWLFATPKRLAALGLDS